MKSTLLSMWKTTDQVKINEKDLLSKSICLYHTKEKLFPKIKQIFLRKETAQWYSNCLA